MEKTASHDSAEGKKPQASSSKSTAAPKDQTARLGSQFYRDNFRWVFSLSIGLVVLVALMIGFMFLQHFTRPSPSYFATENDGTLIKMIPLSQPNLTDSALVSWSVQASTAAYTFNFVDYREALQGVREYFTPRGFQHFLSALEESGNLKDVREKKLVVSAVPQGAPIILKKGPTSRGIYAWQVQLPMLISLQSATEVKKLNITITMLITRVSTTQTPKGIGIAQFIVKLG